jgi:hypothetical protein
VDVAVADTGTVVAMDADRIVWVDGGVDVCGTDAGMNVARPGLADVGGVWMSG